MDETVPPGMERQPESVASRLDVRLLRTLYAITKAISSDLDLDRIVQVVTDGATELTGAKYGAFFYNIPGVEGPHFSLYTLSGAPRSAFERFGLPRKTAVFAPTFDGTSVVRSDDIRKDPRYAKNEPLQGMPAGHLPVVSYLAVPVISRTGEVHGGLLFGHDLPGMFSDEHEELVQAVASHAAIAIDNARLLRASQAEAEFRRKAHESAALLAAIVESSEDAIISKTLAGTITSWNQGAEHIFGYKPEEAIGRPITILIPESRLDEEKSILARVGQGEHVLHFETVRLRKDGTSIDISLAISPIRGDDGTIIGASKVARNITERKRAAERQGLLLREMNHRIKNLFALTGGLVSLAARSAETPTDLARSLKERLTALARAHEMTLPPMQSDGTLLEAGTTIFILLNALVAPYQNDKRDRVCLVGTDMRIGAGKVTNLALLLHEFMTNAAKYGSLSTPNGKLQVDCQLENDELRLEWVEVGGPPAHPTENVGGFGSRLEETLKRGMNATIDRDWQASGLIIRMTLPAKQLQD